MNTNKMIFEGLSVDQLEERLEMATTYGFVSVDSTGNDHTIIVCCNQDTTVVCCGTEIPSDTPTIE